MNGLKTCLGAFFLAALLTARCGSGPSEIHYGFDECAHCRMMITDPAFASQMVTATGKAVKFDAIECMARYRAEHPSEAEDADFWVNDFDDPGSWLRAGEAILVRSEVVRSPMGAGLLALGSKEAAGEHLSEYPGTQVSWEEVYR